jgi:hypothetical protein
MKRMFDYSKLRGKIREVYHTEGDFAKALGISKATLSAKLNGHGGFDQNEITNITNLLRLQLNAAQELFFTLKVK